MGFCCSRLRRAMTRRRAGRPRWQIFQNGNQFDDERRQQQDVKADDPADQNHRHAINSLIEPEAQPSGICQKQLQSVRRHGDGERQNHPGAAQGRHAEEGFEFSGNSPAALKPIRLPRQSSFLKVSRARHQIDPRKNRISSAHASPRAGQGTRRKLTNCSSSTNSAGNPWRKWKRSNPCATA